MNFTGFSSPRVLRGIGCLAAALMLTACAHPISIEPKNVPERPAGIEPSPKKVAYVMSDADRQKQVTTAGGGGDKISYYPYKDFERSLRASLNSIYSGVSVVKSATDQVGIKEADASYVFLPEITTDSSSPSLLTWPPTKFGFSVSVDVLDARATPLAKLRVNGNGAAEWEEFKGDFGLAGRRAVESASKALVDEIQRMEQLK
jgi:hypothetical protein